MRRLPLGTRFGILTVTERACDADRFDRRRRDWSGSHPGRCRVVAATGVKIDWVKAAAGIPAAEATRRTVARRDPGDDPPLSCGTQGAMHHTGRGRVTARSTCASGKGWTFYASVRPVRTLPGVKTPYEKVDLIVVRENTEGLYAGLEHEVVPGVVESVRLITRTAAERIVKFAFELARQQWSATWSRFATRPT